MQTFLPYPDFHKTARCLDYRRLGKQRVEAFQILKALRGETVGWRRHPAVNMWRGYELALACYTMILCQEWTKRGYRSSGSIELYCSQFYSYDPIPMPPWFGDKRFHRAHQSNLIRKDPIFYSPLFPDVPDNLPYIWPVMNTRCTTVNNQVADVHVNP